MAAYKISNIRDEYPLITFYKVLNVQAGSAEPVTFNYQGRWVSIVSYNPNYAPVNVLNFNLNDVDQFYWFDPWTPYYNSFSQDIVFFAQEQQPPNFVSVSKATMEMGTVSGLGSNLYAKFTQSNQVYISKVYNGQNKNSPIVSYRNTLWAGGSTYYYDSNDNVLLGSQTFQSVSSITDYQTFYTTTMTAKKHNSTNLVYALFGTNYVTRLKTGDLSEDVNADSFFENVSNYKYDIEDISTVLDAGIFTTVIPIVFQSISSSSTTLYKNTSDLNKVYATYTINGTLYYSRVYTSQTSKNLSNTLTNTYSRKALLQGNNYFVDTNEKIVFNNSLSVIASSVTNYISFDSETHETFKPTFVNNYVYVLSTVAGIDYYISLKDLNLSLSNVTSNTFKKSGSYVFDDESLLITSIASPQRIYPADFVNISGDVEYSFYKILNSNIVFVQLQDGTQRLAPVLTSENKSNTTVLFYKSKWYNNEYYYDSENDLLNDTEDKTLAVREVDIVNAYTANVFAVVGADSVNVSAVYTKNGKNYYAPLSTEISANNFTTLQGYTFDAEELGKIPSLITYVSLITLPVVAGTLRQLLMNNNTFNSTVLSTLKQKLKEFYILNKRYQTVLLSQTIPENMELISPTVSSVFYQDMKDLSKAYYENPTDGVLYSLLLKNYWMGMYVEDVLENGYHVPTSSAVAVTSNISSLVRLQSKNVRIPLTHIQDSYFKPVETNGKDLIQPYFNASADKFWYNATYDMYVFTGMDYTSPKRVLNGNALSSTLNYIRGSGKTLANIIQTSYIAMNDSLVLLLDNQEITKDMITSSNGWSDLTINISINSLTRLEETVSKKLEYSV